MKVQRVAGGILVLVLFILDIDIDINISGYLSFISPAYLATDDVVAKESQR
jgi:hypothetical protein